MRFLHCRYKTLVTLAASGPLGINTGSRSFHIGIEMNRSSLIRKDLIHVVDPAQSHMLSEFETE